MSKIGQATTPTFVCTVPNSIDLTAANALSSMFDGTGSTFSGTPTINTTYYTSNTVI